MILKFLKLLLIPSTLLLFSCSGDDSLPDNPLQQNNNPAIVYSCTDDTNTSEPYAWYPDLNLARIPFHVAAGPWGPQIPIEAPEAPNTNRSVTVHNVTEFVQEALIPGTEITIGTSISTSIGVLGDVTDVDIIIPPGRHLHDVTLGSCNTTTAITRLRIRGETPMSHSGGILGDLLFCARNNSDIIIDGIDINAENRTGGSRLLQIYGNRIAIVNIRGHAPGFGFLFAGPSTNVVVAGSNIHTGARTRAQSGYPEGWGSRSGDHIVFFRNYMSGTRYHRIRVHPHEGTQYAWVAENTLVDPHEGRIFWASDLAGAGAKIDGVWAQCNKIYAHSAATCMLPSFEAPDANYAQLTHNDFFGSITQTLQQALQQTGQDLLTENRYNPWQTPPPYPPPGDPRSVPLATIDANDYNASLGDGSNCPAP